MRVLVLAAGDGTRWGNYLGVPKHLAPLCDEPILHRAVRLIGEHDPSHDIRIIVKNSRDNDYKVRGSRRAKAKLDPANGDADKFLSSAHLWDTAGRTVLLYGDCFFTRDALAQILDPSPYTGGFRAFSRFAGSAVTGSTNGENFAQVIDPEAHTRYRSCLDRLAGLYRAGDLWRCGGWEQYRAMCGVPDNALRTHVDAGNRTEIDDWTEDLDTPAEWSAWCYAWSRARPDTRPT